MSCAGTAASLPGEPAPPRVVLHRRASVPTSMTAIKEFLPLAPGASAVALLVDEQTSGRGSIGRPWASPVGNMHLTVAVRAPPPRALFAVPLLVALSMHDAVAAALKESPCFAADPAAVDAALRLKWPNDLLWGDAKVGGAIVESSESGEELLVGMGINCAVAPAVGDGGRTSAALAEVVLAAQGEKGVVGSCPPSPVAAPALAQRCAECLVRRLCYGIAAVLRDRRALMEEYAAKMNLDLVMYERGADGSRGQPVRPVSLNADGHLLVRRDDDGTVKELCADYLF